MELAFLALALLALALLALALLALALLALALLALALLALALLALALAFLALVVPYKVPSDTSWNADATTCMVLYLFRDFPKYCLTRCHVTHLYLVFHL
jgi:hypothetical protein